MNESTLNLIYIFLLSRTSFSLKMWMCPLSCIFGAQNSLYLGVSIWCSSNYWPQSLNGLGKASFAFWIFSPPTLLPGMWSRWLSTVKVSHALWWRWEESAVSSMTCLTLVSKSVKKNKQTSNHFCMKPLRFLFSAP